MLKINDKYYIGTDSMNVIVYEHSVSDGKSRNPNSRTFGVVNDTPIAYFATFKGALNFLVDNEIKGTGFEDYQSIVSKIEELYKTIDALPTPNRI